MSTLFRIPTLRQELAFTLRLGPPTSTDLTSDQGWPTPGDPGFGLQLGRLAMGRVLGRFPRLPDFSVNGREQPVRAENLVHVMRPGGIRLEAAGVSPSPDTVAPEIDWFR